MTTSKEETSEKEESVYGEVAITRMLAEGAAWLVGFGCARRLCSGVHGAIAEADQVADHFAARFGVKR